MDNATVIKIFASLAQETRLSLFRLLVQAGPEGLPAGRIAEQLGLPASTLSFHLKELTHAGIVNARQAGRFIYYSADYAAMSALIAFLTENCCGGNLQECCPLTAMSKEKLP
jgi:ArsR family transcriptional regulator